MFPLITSCASFNLIISSPSTSNFPPRIPAYLAQQMTPLSQGHAADGEQQSVVLRCEQCERQWEKQTRELRGMDLPADPRTHHSKLLTTGDNGNVFLAIIARITTSRASEGAEHQQASEAAL